MLCRRHGAQLCYTPILHSKLFAESAAYRERNFSTCAGDRHLVAQFCANDPQTLLDAAKLIEHQVDAVDINLGCPQMIARRGRYGAYLMEDWPLIFQLVRRLHDGLSVPVFCKIRVFPDADKTVAYAQMLESAGCQLLAVHGRTREQRKTYDGDGRFVAADWAIIKRIKESVSVPVIANGNIQTLDDVERCLQFTGADAVMSALAALCNPALFSGRSAVSDFDLVYEYLQLARHYDTNVNWVRAHLGKMLEAYFADYRDKLLPLFNNECHNIDGVESIVRDLQRVVQSGRGPLPPSPKSPPSDDPLPCFGSDYFDRTLVDIFA